MHRHYWAPNSSYTDKYLDTSSMELQIKPYLMLISCKVKFIFSV